MSVNDMRMDKTVFSIAHLYDPSDEKEFWLSKSPTERILAIEQMRQILYGYDPTNARLQRVLEIIERS